MHQTQSYHSQQASTFQPASMFRQLPLIQRDFGQPVSHSSSTTNPGTGQATAQDAFSNVLNTMKAWVGGQSAQSSRSGQQNGTNLQNATIEFTAKPNSMELDIETPKQSNGKRSLGVDLNVQGIGTSNPSNLSRALLGMNGLFANALGQTNTSTQPNQLAFQPASSPTTRRNNNLLNNSPNISPNNASGKASNNFLNNPPNNPLNGATIEFEAKPNSVHLDLETPRSSTGQRSLDIDVDLHGVGTSNVSQLPGAINSINELLSGIVQPNSQTPLKLDLDMSINQSSPQQLPASGMAAPKPRHAPAQLANPGGKPPKPRHSSGRLKPPQSHSRAHLRSGGAGRQPFQRSFQPVPGSMATPASNPTPQPRKPTLLEQVLGNRNTSGYYIPPRP